MNARPHTIYIVRPAGFTGPYKVGCTTNIEKRVRNLSAASPFPLELLCRFIGGVDVERRIHALLRPAHIRCEWFSDCPQIHRLIASVADGSFDADTLPAPVRIDRLQNGMSAAERRFMADYQPKDAAA